MDPWECLAEQHPYLRVEYRGDLPSGEVGQWHGGDVITLGTNLDSVGRRCTLAHELIHVERGLCDGGPITRAHEERIVEAAAARWLLNPPDIVCGLLWSSDEDELAAYWRVDIAMARCRWSTLRGMERAWIVERLPSEVLWHLPPASSLSVAVKSEQPRTGVTRCGAVVIPTAHRARGLDQSNDSECGHAADHRPLSSAEDAAGQLDLARTHTSARLDQ